MIKITIFAPADDMANMSPRGFSLVDQAFKEAGYKDPVTTTQSRTKDLQRNLNYLVRRYPGRLSVEWVNPWTLQGLLVAVRYRLRVLPSVLLRSKTQKIILVAEELEQLSELVAEMLSQNPDN